ncbi:putative inscuteable, partial [Operophtera brumata]
MSNFQRTRSKVWWGDEPAAAGSPVAQPNWNNPAKEPEWEPQLPHWIANEPEQQNNNSADNIPPPNVQIQINQWPLRHGSPGSHKSQDSGFSDSDSSPPPSQYFSPPDTNDSKNNSSSSDSNNNENITVKQAIDFQNTPHKDVVDSAKEPDTISNGAPTPKPRNRSSSLIQTPYDLQKYYEIHTDEEHMELLKDNDTGDLNKTEPKYPTPKNMNNEKLNKSKSTNVKSTNYPKIIKNNVNVNNKAEKNLTPTKNVIIQDSPNKSAIQTETKDVHDKNLNIISPSKKYPVKAFVSSPEGATNAIKVATVKDLETSKNNKSDENVEIIKLCDNNEIAVKNQPRMRTPISNVSYVPTERSSIAKKEYKRSFSNEYELPITTTPVFQRTRLNKSLNFEGQRLDQQILDIQDGYHSLGFINEDVDEETFPEIEQVHKPKKALLGKNIMDSLHLKPQKKVGPKAKHRANKADKTKDMFRIFPKKEKPGTVDSHAGGTLKGSRVPSLGLPRSADHDSWVFVGYPADQELLIPHYNERLVGESDVKSAKDQENILKDRLSPVTPPPQFQDEKTPNEADFKTDKDLSHDSKREKFKDPRDDGGNFAEVRMNLASTSTPKMLAPHEYMNSLHSTSGRKSQTRRENLYHDLNGLVLNNQNEILYRERSIDQTKLERLCERKPEPVQYWLCELASSSENECMTTLQSKPLGAEVKAQVQIESNQISEDQICLLVANINEFVLAHSITLNTKPPGETPERWDKIKRSLQLYLQKLIDIGEDVKVELNETTPEWTLTLVSIIEEPPSDLILKSTLTSIGHLAMLSEGPESAIHERCAKVMKEITELPFVDCGVPRALLTAIIESNKSSIKALSLRALATVCVTADAVKQHSVRPLQPGAADARGYHGADADHGALAARPLRPDAAPRILSRTECCQLLLLCTACLVNLVRELELERAEDSNPTSDIVEIITKHRTVERLLDAVKRRGPNISVFLQEQTASLLVSLSRIPRCMAALSRVRAVSVALSITSFMFNRLSVMPDVAHQIVQLEGVPHLTRLVRAQRTRPTVDTNPDQTLIHCLKALRILYKHCPVAFNDYEKDVGEMIRPHLMESLMLFSAKQESYV